MKFSKYIHRGLVGLCAFTFWAGQARAQSTWTGHTSTAWNYTGNWIPGIPITDMGLNFGGATYGAVATLPANDNITGLITGASNFNNTNLAGQTTLGTLGQSIDLGGNISTATVNFSPANTTITEFINLNSVLHGTRMITTSTSRTRNHGIKIFGVISEKRALLY